MTQRAAEIARRLEVSAVRFSPGPLAGTSEEAGAAAVPRPTSLQEREADRIASAIESDDLRETVAKVVSLGLARTSADHAV